MLRYYFLWRFDIDYEQAKQDFIDYNDWNAGLSAQDKVLLVRHTYGGANGKLLIPGGYCNVGELPEEAACREVMEGTGVEAKVGGVLGIRCNRKNWYMLMVMEHIKGGTEK